MAIFGKSDSELKSNQTNSNTTIITTGAKIEGSLELSCNLYIDGELDGEINSQKEVNIGKNGFVKGKVVSKRLVVQGYMEGSIEATRVEIKSAGHVKGEIVSSELLIEPNGIFEGSSIRRDSDTSKIANKADISKS